MAHHSLTTTDAADTVTALTVEHLWLADAIARRFQGRGEEVDDLRQVARCGLLEAAQRYEPDQGAFVPFASSTINGVLKRHFRDHGWMVRPPRQTQQLALLITRQWSEVAQECRGRPSDAVLAESLGESVPNIREARRASSGYRATSMESVSLPAAVTASTDPGFERCEAQLLITQAWRLLEPSERELLQMRFWENRSQSDIAQRIGTSQMQVSRLLTRTIGRIRELLQIDVTAASA